MKILLINPTHIIKEDKNMWKSVTGCLPPIGLAQIAACLEQEHIEVRILDMNAEKMPLKNLKKFLHENKKFDFIGITVSIPLLKNAYSIAKICKKKFPESKVVFGGIYPTVRPNEVLQNKYVDFAIRGEAEITFKELTQKSKEEILGLSYKIDNKIVNNQDRPPLDYLDSIPDPAYHLLPIKKYRSSIGSYKRTPSISMIISRGCPGQCTFCHSGSSNAFGKIVRYRSPQRVINQIMSLQKEYGIKEISFYDDNFTTSSKFVKEFCSLLMKNKIDLTWSCFSRVDSIRDINELKTMKKAGCHQISLGIESGDQAILTNIKKHVTLKKCLESIKLIKKAGISTRCSFMIGNPGETIKTMEKTLNFALKLDPDFAVFNITTPYPGTEMYDWAIKNKYLHKKKNIEKFTLVNSIMNLPTVSKKDVEYYYKKMYRKFYLRPKYIVKRIFKINSLRDFKDSLLILRSLVKI